MRTARARPNVFSALDRADQEPLYRQVKRRILDMIVAGTLPAHAKLPSERELLTQLDVSRITVRQALTELVQEGYLRSQPGKGFYVAARREPFEMHLLRSFTATARDKGVAPGSRLLEARIYPAPTDITAPLELPAGAHVLLLRRLRTHDGTPVVIQSDWIAPARVPGLIDLDWSTGNRSLYAELSERYGIQPVRGRTLLSARLATAAEAGLLDLDIRSAVLTLEQIAFDGSGRPVNLSAQVHHPIRYPLQIAQI